MVGGGAGHHEIAGLGLHAQAVATDGVKMVAAGDEGDVVAVAGQHAAEVSADAAGAHNCYFHRSNPLVCLMITIRRPVL